MKTCTKCHLELDTSCFYKTNRSKSGLMSWCKVCESNRCKIKNKANRDRRLAKAKEWRDKNKKKQAESVRRWRNENPDRVREIYRNWRNANKDRANKNWMRREAGKKKRTPAWLTEDQHNMIGDFYWLASDLKAITGEDYHVDHIVPLNGKNVCGLHVPWNLQVLPADINRVKSNRLPAEGDHHDWRRQKADHHD